MLRETDASPTPGSLIARATQLTEVLAANAGRIEAEKCIPADIAELLVDAGFFRITQPRDTGGFGFSPRTLWEVVFQIAAGCPSTAWVLSLAGANLLMVGRFQETARAAVFDSSEAPIVAVLTGGVGENVRVERVAGGLRISGKWRYASGIDIASWAGLLINVPGAGGGGDRASVVLVPKRAFTIDHTSWNVLGMRGTGSKDILLPETFVPETHCAEWDTLQGGCSADGACALPLNVLFAMSVLAPTLGVASLVASEVKALVSRRWSAGTKERQLNDQKSQIDVATGLATMDLLRTNLLADTDRLVETVGAGREVDLETRARIRMKIALSSRLALATAQQLLADVGGSLLPQGTCIERAFRDIHAMSSHFLLQPSPIGEAFGRLSLGLSLPPSARL